MLLLLLPAIFRSHGPAGGEARRAPWMMSEMGQDATLDEVGAMLDKMESAMQAMELAMESARADDQQSSAGEREALVARVQQELRSVMSYLPPPVRERITPKHPTMFRTLIQDLDVDRRAFIEKWADGVRKHGHDFETWVRTRNQGDSDFRFLTEPASADARYYQGCIDGMVQSTRLPEEAAGPAAHTRESPGTGARLGPRRKRSSAAQPQNVFQRLASPPRANVQKIVAGGRLRADGSWSPRAISPTVSRPAQSRLASPRRTKVRSSLSQRQKAAEDVERHRARLASPPRAKAQSPTSQVRRPAPRHGRSRGSVGGRGSSSAREQALVERLSSPTREIRSKVTSPSRTRSAWIISGPGSTADVGAPDLHSLEVLGEIGMTSGIGNATRRHERKPGARRANKHFAEDQMSWTERREEKLRQKRLEMDQTKEQERLRYEEERVVQQLQRARRRAALGVDSAGPPAKDFTERSHAWAATRQQAIEAKRQELEKSGDIDVKFTPTLSKKSKKIARGMAPLTDRIEQIEQEKKQKLEAARRQQAVAEEELCMQPGASVVASRAKSKVQHAVQQVVASPSSAETTSEPNTGNGVTLAEQDKVQAELERAEAEYRALEEQEALELKLEEEMKQEELEQGGTPVPEPAAVLAAEKKPERAMSAAAMIGAKVRAAGGKMRSLQQELGELKDELSSVQTVGTPVVSQQEPERPSEGGMESQPAPDPAPERSTEHVPEPTPKQPEPKQPEPVSLAEKTAPEPALAPDLPADDPYAEIEAMGLGTGLDGADDPFVQLAAMKSSGESSVTEDAFAESKSLVA